MAEEPPLGLPPLQASATLDQARQQRIQSAIRADSAEQKPQVFDTSLSDMPDAPHSYDLTGEANHHQQLVNQRAAHLRMRDALPMPPPLNSPLPGTAGQALPTSSLHPAAQHPSTFMSLLLQQQQNLVSGARSYTGANVANSLAGRCAGFACMPDMMQMPAMPTSAHATAAAVTNLPCSPSFMQSGRVCHMQHGEPAPISPFAHQGASGEGSRRHAQTASSSHAARHRRR